VSTARARRLAATIIAGVVVTIAGCSGGVQGTYIGVKGQSFFDEIELSSSGKVKVTVVGVPYEATYEVKDSKVVINNGGQIHELVIEKNCLVDPIGGRYCKGGSG
jgi:hypothetical protein